MNRYMVRIDNKHDADIAVMFLCNAVNQDDAKQQAIKKYPDKNISVVVKLNKEQ